MKRRSIILGLVSAAALVLGGLAPSASASATHSGVEHITAVQTSETGPQVIIGVGPIHARGYDVSINNHHDRFVFPAGSIKIAHWATTTHQSYDPKTCTGRVNETGTYTVTGGTGRYDDASGHGDYHLQIYFIGCNQNDPSNIFSLVIHASGPLSY